MNQNRGLDSSRSINVSSEVLVMQLNQLLASLNISINLDSHSQLAPSLLIAILESLMSTRLNISQDHRATLSSSETAKVHCMKIFLGVFQADILKQDVGISSVDPRRLARGEEEETLYVARLLCWYGRHKGRISRSGAGAGTRRVRDMSLSPSTFTTVTRNTATDVSAVHPESNTTASDVDGLSFDDVLHSVVVPARCIHEVPSPSLVLSPGSHFDDLAESCLFAPSHTNSSVRYDGHISVVDEDVEIAAFEARRRAQAKGKGKRSHSTPYAPVLSRDLDVDEVSVDADVLAADDVQIMELRRRKAELLDKLAELRLNGDKRMVSQSSTGP